MLVQPCNVAMRSSGYRDRKYNLGLLVKLEILKKDEVPRINLSEVENSSITIQESWKKRYKALHKEFSDFGEGIKTYNKIRIGDKNILKKSVFNGSLFSGYKIDNENSLCKRGKFLEFIIQRIAHYKSPYSDDLLQKFMLYLSRNAFEHDFTRG